VPLVIANSSGLWRYSEDSEDPSSTRGIYSPFQTIQGTFSRPLGVLPQRLCPKNSPLPVGFVTLSELGAPSRSRRHVKLRWGECLLHDRNFGRRAAALFRSKKRNSMRRESTRNASAVSDANWSPPSAKRVLLDAASAIIVQEVCTEFRLTPAQLHSRSR